MKIISLTALLLTALGALELSAAPPTPIPLGPALTTLGAKYAPTYFSKEPALQFKADAPLTEEVWKEIEALAPRAAAASGKGIDDAAVVRLSTLPLETLSLDGVSLTDEGWVVFKEMRQLKKLTLGHNQKWKGTGAAALANHPTLTSLSIGGTTFGDVGMPAIATLKQLTTLSFVHSGITDAGFALMAGHPALESLTLAPQMNPRITEAVLGTIATFKQLQNLRISETVLTYDGGLKLLKTLPNLKKLQMDKIGASEADLAKLKADLPGVEVKFTPADPAALAKWHEQFAKMQAAKK